jgi:hypothetical protein
MATETKKIIVRKGLNAQIPDLDEGEPAFTIDTQKFFVGTAGGHNVELSSVGHEHTISNITNLQTTLDGKANTSHTHTLSNITNAGTVAAVNLNNNGAQFLKGDGTWGVPTIAAGSAEWNYIGATTVSNGTVIIDSAVIGGAYDLANYDYKFVLVAETSDEDNSELFIRINNITTNSYKYVYTRASSSDNSTLVFSDKESNRIVTGTLLPGNNTGVAYTNVEIEFVLSRSYGVFTVFSTDNYNYIIKGQGITTAMNAPVTNTIYPLISNFIGNIQLTAAVNTVEIVHDITAGTVDTAKVRVYRRNK